MTIEAIEKRSKLDDIAMTVGGGAILANLGDAWTIATAVKNAGMAPRGLDTPAKVLIALMAGAEAGLPPMATLKFTMIVNGIPTLYGDGPIALVLRSGQLKAQRSGIEGVGDARFAWYEAERKGIEGVSRSEYSVADAKRAKLWGKAGPWSSNPDRMQFFRSRAFVLRDLFGDVLQGFSIAEEVEEYAAVSSPEEPATGSEGLLRALTKDGDPEAQGEPEDDAQDAVWDEVEQHVRARDGSLFEGQP